MGIKRVGGHGRARRKPAVVATRRGAAPRRHNERPRPPVKSASRVLKIFEYFDQIRRGERLPEISRVLKIPQSSAHGLMRSLLSMGYLSHDAASGSYSPTLRLASLGSWVNREAGATRPLQPCMRALQLRTNSAVVLATRAGLHAQYIEVLQATSPARLHLSVGALRPLVASGTGYALLSMCSDEQVRAIAESSAAQGIPEQAVEFDQLMRRIEKVRRDGYAISLNMVTPGGGVLAVPLLNSPQDQPLVLAIAGISAVLRASERELARQLRDTVAEFLPNAIRAAGQPRGGAANGRK